jgi:ribosomal protein S18 acetylase RimI-like enzyme
MFVFDIEIDAEHRGRGLGRAAMLAAERVVADAGRSVIGLNVFGPNRRARRLYESLGYRTESMQLAKDI